MSKKVEKSSLNCPFNNLERKIKSLLMHIVTHCDKVIQFYGMLFIQSILKQICELILSTGIIYVYA